MRARDSRRGSREDSRESGRKGKRKGEREGRKSRERKREREREKERGKRVNSVVGQKFINELPRMQQPPPSVPLCPRREHFPSKTAGKTREQSTDPAERAKTHTLE